MGTPARTPALLARARGALTVRSMLSRGAFPLTIVALAAVIASLAGAAPAYANFIGTDPPGSGGDGQNSETNVAGNVICVNGDAWLTNPRRSSQIPTFPGVRGELWFARPNNMCPLNGVVTEQDRPRSVFGGSRTALRQVPAGWEVWRFYGQRSPDGSNTVSGFTVSFAAARDWGDGSEVVTITPHPDDRGIPVTRGPWRERVITNLSGEQVTLAEGGLVSTNPPFRNGGQRCSALRTPDAVRRAFAADPGAVRSTLFEGYEVLVRSGGGRWGWRTAAAGINAANTSPIGGPGQIIYDDGIDCTSPYEFASLDSGQLSISGVYQGSCVVPVTRLQQRLTDGSWATRASYGARYSAEYGPSDDYKDFRALIAEEVGRRSGSPHLRYHSHRTPGQPSQALAGQDGGLLTRYNQAQAAGAASQYAACREGLLGLPPSGDGGERTTDPRVTIAVDIPEVFQIGGQLRTGQTIWAGHNELVCDGGACPIRVERQPVQNRDRALTADHLTSVRYQLTVDVDGLRRCRTSNPAEQCDYTIDGPDDRGGWTAYPTQPAGEPRGPSAQQSTAAHRERRQRVDMTFYAATNPGEQVRVSIRDVSATYATYSWGRTQLGVTNCIQNVDGAPLGTTAGASAGSEGRRWDGAPYHPNTPGGNVSQWQDAFRYVEHAVARVPVTVNGRTVLWFGNNARDARPSPWTERIPNGIEWVTVPLWECRTGVFDDVEVSRTVDLPSSQIRVVGVGSRPVIGVNQRR